MTWLDIPAILLITGLLIALASVALTFGSESRWVGHAVTGTIALVLMFAVILTGAVQRGRIRAIRIHSIFRFHRMLSIGFSAFVVGTFILGLLTTMEHGEPVLQSVHGLLGLIVAILALVQLVPSLVTTRRTGIRLPHMIIGYLIVSLLVLQVVIGLGEAGFILPFIPPN